MLKASLEEIRGFDQLALSDLYAEDRLIWLPTSRFFLEMVGFMCTRLAAATGQYGLQEILVDAGVQRRHVTHDARRSAHAV